MPDIKAMAVEAKEWALAQLPAHGPDSFQRLRDEKFAQLVARECARLADGSDYGPIPHRIGDQIRARFGLEG